ncbi:MAG: hypothetical protein AAF740_04895, partial [Bacteroidota bacterium]
MKNIYTLLFGFVLFGLGISKTSATHIVGGELELTHVQGTIYRAGLIMYFDAVNGNPGAIDEELTVHIFDKRTDELKVSITLPRISDRFVSYTNPTCAVGDLVTRRIAYARDFNLQPDEYAEPQGYYMVWERCCRNGTIDNIINPGDVGQTFYLEFPPLIRNGQRFINSSPRIFPPLSDYACAGQPFTFNFSGTDADGDVLTYRLSAPIAGNSRPSPADLIQPGPIAAPYDPVRFIGGLGVNNMIPGSPPLRIDPTTGFIGLTADSPGLYVFAVTVEEFRNGRKIGEVRREFQLLVLDCPSANIPRLRYVPEGETSAYDEGDVITLKPGVENCGELTIRDIDPNTIIGGTVLPINFGDVGEVLATSAEFLGEIDGEDDELVVEFCLEGCPDPNIPQYELQIIIGDNSCAVPLFDTLNVLVEFEELENIEPEITSNVAVAPPEGEECLQAEVFLGDLLEVDIIGDDGNADTIRLSAEGLVNGMSFPTQVGLPPLTNTFSYRPGCDALPEGEDSVVQRVEFYVEDLNPCFPSTFDTLCLDVLVKNRVIVNVPPELSADLNQGADGVYRGSVVVGEAFDFEVLGQDTNGDSLVIELFGEGFDPTALGVTFAPPNGFAPLSSNFSWQTDCEDVDDFETPKTYEFEVIVTDFDFCGEPQVQDTILLELEVVPEPNTAPELTTNFTFDASTNTFCDTIRITETLEFDVFGNDAEADSLLITGEGIDFNFADIGMEFSSISGRPTLTAPFRWATSCEQIGLIEYGRAYEIQFFVQDFKFCPEQELMDTINVKIVVLPPEDIDSPPTVEATAPFD